MKRLEKLLSVFGWIGQLVRHYGGLVIQLVTRNRDDNSRGGGSEEPREYVSSLLTILFYVIAGITLFSWLFAFIWFVSPSTIIRIAQITVLGSPILYWSYYFVAFTFGLGLIPLIAYTIGPMLGSLVPELMATLMLMLSNIGLRRPVLYQRETDEYELIRGSASWGPASYWNHWALRPFGITFERTEEAFEPYVVSDEEKERIRNLVPDGSGRVDIDNVGHGSADWWVNANRVDDILVRIGSFLKPLDLGGSPRYGLEAIDEALEEFGMDTSGQSLKVEVGGLIFFLAMGIITGAWVFF